MITGTQLKTIRLSGKVITEDDLNGIFDNYFDKTTDNVAQGKTTFNKDVKLQDASLSKVSRTFSGGSKNTAAVGHRSIAYGEGVSTTTDYSITSS